MLAASWVMAAQPQTPSFGVLTTFTSSNTLPAAVSAPIGLWPVATIYGPGAMAQSGTLGLTWNAPTNSLGQHEADGFYVSYGDITQNATNKWNVGTNTTAVLYKLNTNQTYFFFCTAYIGAVESLPSNLVVVKPQ